MFWTYFYFSTYRFILHSFGGCILSSTTLIYLTIPLWMKHIGCFQFSYYLKQCFIEYYYTCIFIQIWKFLCRIDLQKIWIVKGYTHIKFWQILSVFATKPWPFYKFPTVCDSACFFVSLPKQDIINLLHFHSDGQEKETLFFHILMDYLVL